MGELVRNRTAVRLAWSLAGVSVSLSLGGLVFGLLGHESFVSFNGPFAVVGVFPFALLGAILASRRPSNPIGWLFCAIAVDFAFNILAQSVAKYGLQTNPGSVPGAAIASWLALWSWIPAVILLLIFCLLLYPDGYLPSRRWRPLAWAGILAIPASVMPVAIEGWPLRGPKLLYENEPPPTMPHAFRTAVSVEEMVLFLTFLGAFIAAASLVVRMRRATGDEREQIRWFAYGGFVLAVAISANVFFLNEGGALAPLIGFAAIPVAATIALLKYRLYDIDVVISKTVVYGVLAAFLTLVYVAIVVGIGSAVGSRSSRPLTILAAVVMAVTFQPARERARQLANRIVYGERATPYEVLSQFAERMAGTYSTEDVLPQMAQILAGGTGASVARVWLRVGDRLRVAASWPPESSASLDLIVHGEGLPPFPEAHAALPVVYQGQLLGALSVAMPPNERLVPVQEKLIRDLASQAGLVLRNVRLIEELRASRQRLVAAQDEERRKLERNLHDGAQQQLVALAVKQRLAATLVGRDPEKAAEMMEELQGDTTEALENLRNLARGIYPPLLSDQGLAAALGAQARKAAVPVTVESDGIGRYPQPAETAVYFCCLEALQNVAKYAHASQVVIHLSEQDGYLTFAVEDDGDGFDPERTSLGTGVQGMIDRVDAVGGTLEVRSDPGRGTIVTGRIPVRAMA
jgi:signal transduction histidine kinase